MHILQSRKNKKKYRSADLAMKMQQLIKNIYCNVNKSMWHDVFAGLYCLVQTKY